jgi:hemerythrin-like domain-containing protein
MYTHLVNQTLHNEHEATLALLDQLEKLVARGGSGKRDSLDASHLRATANFIDTELRRHFDFEEQSLFGLLAEAGDDEICEHLLHEHEQLLGLGARLGVLARGAAAGTLDAAGEQELKRVALQFAAELRGHIDKEESSLLPALEDALDEQTDARLNEAYALTA